MPQRVTAIASMKSCAPFLPFLPALLLLAGCASSPLQDPVIGPSYAPQNVWRASESLPASLRRVAILPSIIPHADPVYEQGRTITGPVLFEELIKSGRFEVVRVSPADLQEWTGRADWASDDLLPPDLLNELWKRTGCDAVLFSRLTVYRPYGTLAIGWRASLISTPIPSILWSADEVFDSGNPSVANAARRYYKAHETAPTPLADSKAILQAPRRFARYTVHALAETLPSR